MEFLGNIVGFAIFVGIVYIIIKTKGCHPQNFELEENEEIVEMTKGDYWEVQFFLSKKRSAGEIAFTNKRIIFRENFFNNVISVPYSDIADIKKSFVVLFPVAIDIKTKDEKSYRFAMMKRDHFIDLINSLAKAN